MRVWAQPSNDRCRYIKIFNTPIAVDTLSIIPNSLSSSEQGVSFTYLQSEDRIIVQYDGGRDSIQICYKVFPFNFQHTYYNRSLSIYDSAALFKDTRRSPALMEKEELFPTEGIQKSGTVSRGISFGNNQDVVVNSTLNLNLEGQLTDDLKIRAAITDQNIPFQPEGNTQQLQDFDNVYFEIYNDDFSLLAGDVVLTQQPSRFLKYHKNVQGGRARIKYHPGGTDAETSVGLSVAKGQFASVSIDPREGVLGPYRVPGPEGQNFVIILANSEKVFLDGKLLQRGFNQDYVIDYNAAQITFTNKVIITEFSRIRIDYEYSDQNYNRTIATFSHEQTIGKWKIFAQGYSESDNRNQPILVDLDTNDKIRLSEAGDQIQKAFSSGEDSVAFTNDQVLYEKRDTLNEDGLMSSIYYYSTDPSKAFYRVSFSLVGNNQGDYVYDRSTANGRIYKWISPHNGIPQGTYAPVIRLPAPNKKQMITGGFSYDISKHEQIYAEGALSTVDQNLFSDLDDQNNRGTALKSGFVSKGRDFHPIKSYKWSFFTDFETDQRDFQPIDRYRDIEYNRDWNFDPIADTLKNADHIFNVGGTIEKDPSNIITYRFTYRKRGDQVNGTQNVIRISKELGKFQYTGDLFIMHNAVPDKSASWIRHQSDLSFQTKSIIPGYRFSLDHNKVQFNDRDTSAMYYDQHEFYIRNGPDAGMDFDLRYSYRQDKQPLEGQLIDYSTAQTARAVVGKSFENHRLNLIATYRELYLKEKDITEQSISGRLEWQGNMLDKHIQTDLTYSVSNSQELRKEFVFIKVPSGEGTHTWRDLNEDNIQDLDEFFIAVNPDERNYAKIFVPTDDYITAFQNLLIAQVRLEMPRTWKESDGIRKLLGRLSNNTSWTADNKTTSDKLADKLFTFARDLDDDLILAERSIFRSTSFYNRSSSLYGMEFTYLESHQKQLLTNGFEGASNKSSDLSIRFNPSRTYNFNLRLGKLNKEVSSDFLPDRNYRITGYKYSPETAWQPGNFSRLTLSFQHEYQENVEALDDPEWSRSNQYSLEYRFSKAASSVINARVSVVDITFKGEENTPVGYDLLTALKPGTNITWNFTWQQKIARGLQINISYDGRKSEDSRIIHVGRVQVSALF